MGFLSSSHRKVHIYRHNSVLMLKCKSPGEICLENKVFKTQFRRIYFNVKNLPKNIGHIFGCQGDYWASIWSYIDQGKTTNMITDNICGSFYLNIQIFKYGCSSLFSTLWVCNPIFLPLLFSIFNLNQDPYVYSPYHKIDTTSFVLLCL